MPAHRSSRPLFARFYARVSPAMDAGGIAARRLLEHVRADSPGWRRAQHLLGMTIWPAVCGGDHTGRDTAAAVRAAGFTIEHLDRFRFPGMRLTLPTSPHLSAIASRTP